MAICKSPAGQYGYHGVRISDGAKLIASASASADGSYVAKQDGVTYTVTSSALVVSDASGVIRREPMVSFHGPKTAQAPAGAAQTPAAKPQAPAALGPDDSDVDGAATPAAARRSRRRQALVRLRRSRNRLTHGVAVDSLDPEFTTVAAVLDAAERGGGIHDVALVDAEGA